MNRLAFELLNDHFNSLADDDSIVLKKLLFKFGFVEATGRIFFSSDFLNFSSNARVRQTGHWNTSRQDR